MTGERAADVAVLIPARNEAESIRRCLEHVLAQDIGRERLEVIVVDGDSIDGTGEIARSILQEAGVARWVVHHNAHGSTPSNLNAGLVLVSAPIVCRVDARSLVPPGYARTCAETLTARPDVAVVGGAQIAVARSSAPRDAGIARALNNRWGMGLARYRRGARSAPADTVYLGSFRTEQLRVVGGWDERFLTNQDFELNRRLSKSGLVWFEATLRVGYLPRTSVSALFRQYRRFGVSKIEYWRLSGDRPRVRQLAALSVGPGLILALVAIGLSGHPLRRMAVGCGVIAIGAASVDQLGATGGAPASERLWSVSALLAVWSGWSLGAWIKLIRVLQRPLVRG